MADSIISAMPSVPPPTAGSTLIVGGGIAGIFAALKLAPHPVTILTAAPFGEGASSAWAQGGIAAAVGEGDTPEKHLADTLIAGAGIVDTEIAHLMTSEARARIEDLLAYGVPFDRDLEGKLQTGREAAHSERRIVHVNGDTAGKAIMAALIETVRKTSSIRVIENLVAERLTLSDGRVTGVMARGARGTAANAVHFPARAVVLATGGIGHLYAVTTNPPEANGNGVALAARAGATLADLEFVQFHPTAVDIGRDPAPLATEALRGEGAVLINSAGERFMQAVQPGCRTCSARRRSTGDPYRDRGGTRRRSSIAARRSVPGLRHGFRLSTHPASQAASIPLPCRSRWRRPSTIIWGASSPTRMDAPLCRAFGLAAKSPRTGVHGANRLASNSLLEAVVFATRVAADIAAQDTSEPAPIGQDNVAANLQPSGPADAETIVAIRRVMAEDVGVIRNAAGLTRALARLSQLERAAKSAMVQNMVLVARLITTAARDRAESRGGHYRSDFPETDPAQAHRSFMALAGGQDRTQAVPAKKVVLA